MLFSLIKYGVHHLFCLRIYLLYLVSILLKVKYKITFDGLKTVHKNSKRMYMLLFFQHKAIIILPTSNYNR